MRIIGLCGRKGSGKNVVGTYLETYGYEQVSFAAKLKESAAAVFDINPERFEVLKNDPDAIITLGTPDEDIAWLTVRQYLQRYGTEAHRDVFGYDFWRRELFTSLPQGTYKKYAITDVRFDDELRAVRERGGKVWRVNRALPDDGDTHASEADPDPALIDGELFNDGSFEELYAQVDILVRLEDSLEEVRKWRT